MSGQQRTRRAPAIATSVAVAGAVGVLAVRIWVLEPVTVASTSMEPTVARGDTVVLSHLVPPADESLMGRVVALRNPQDGEITLKRVAAEGGQTVEIRDGVVFVDDVAVAEPYVDPRSTDGTFFHDVTVPDDHVFVLGDNRVASIDSRDFGVVPREDVTATVLWTF